MFRFLRATEHLRSQQITSRLISPIFSLNKAGQFPTQGITPCAGFSSARYARQSYQDSRGYTHFRKKGTASFGAALQDPRKLAFAGATLAMGSAAYLYNLETVPVTGRTHLILLSKESERYYGETAYKQLREEHKSKILSSYHPAVRKVERIGRQLIHQLPETFPGKEAAHLSEVEWEFTVIVSPEVNAFVLPGGKVCVFTGLLQLFPTDNELATVLGHEIAHVVARHSAEKVTNEIFFTMLKIALLVLIDFTSVISATVAIGLELPFSRRCEHEADLLGIQLMSAACFDPRVAPAVYSKLGQAEVQQKEINKYLSTHPTGQDRAKKLNEALPSALARFSASGCSESRYETFLDMWRENISH